MKRRKNGVELEVVNDTLCKKCSKCGKILSLDFFSKRTELKCGYRSNCNICAKKYRDSKADSIKKYQKEKYKKDKNKKREYYLQNKERILKRNKERYCAEEAKIKREASKEYFFEYRRRPHVKKRVNDRYRQRYHSELNFKVSVNIRSRTGNAIRNALANKIFDKRMEFLGCSIKDFTVYFESKFTDGMSWENFMSGEIHIDHIRPCASFDLTDPEQQKQCFHYTNLQPLWEKDNLSKGDKLL